MSCSFDALLPICLFCSASRFQLFVSVVHTRRCLKRSAHYDTKLSLGSLVVFGRSFVVLRDVLIVNRAARTYTTHYQPIVCTLNSLSCVLFFCFFFFFSMHDCFAYVLLSAVSWFNVKYVSRSNQMWRRTHIHTHALFWAVDETK